ncbi:hypothetical protein E5329_03150 [Petralouisia muris]|uniref:Uncharacterized protein n=1 Tax=Petralouisia muris TaxID=3032872 RepID=A0AC61S0M8_9FIRM|nr:hypothetical protein [Petralouisia muris]TGY97861.1 hypothetical protein E5329_03150 [Petralouisia muris]
MQEWQRFLVCIEEKHNYLRCAECGKIIKPAREDSSIYQCSCGKQFQERNTVKYAGAARNFTEQYLGEIFALWEFLEV